MPPFAISYLSTLSKFMSVLIMNRNFYSGAVTPVRDICAIILGPNLFLFQVNLLCFGCHLCVLPTAEGGAGRKGQLGRRRLEYL